MSSEEVLTAKEGESAKASQKSDVDSSTNGKGEQTNVDDASKAEGAPGDKKATSPTEGKTHVSAHERDREEQASRRVREAQKYNSRDKRGRGGHRGGRGGRGGYPNNNRFDPSKQEKTDDPVAIRKQVRIMLSSPIVKVFTDLCSIEVEFYFSESNLLTDKFLFEKVDGHKNVPVPIDVIHSFKRMQHFQPREAIIEALKDSHVLDIVEDDTAIQRKEPLPEGLTGKSMDEVQKVHEDRSMAKSVYVKGFGDESSTTQFDIEAWFANHGLTNSVRLRRDPNKGFKGSVFVEFDTEETQQSFLAVDPPPKWKGKNLEIKSKKQYCDEKVEDINSGRIRKNSPNPHYDDRREKRPRRGSPAYGDKKRDHADGEDTRDWRQRRDEEAGNGYRGNRNKNRGNASRHDRGGKGGKESNEKDQSPQEKEVE